jgi:hypothetical protein
MSDEVEEEEDRLEARWPVRLASECRFTLRRWASIARSTQASPGWQWMVDSAGVSGVELILHRVAASQGRAAG